MHLAFGGALACRVEHDARDYFQEILVAIEPGRRLGPCAREEVGVEAAGYEGGKEQQQRRSPVDLLLYGTHGMATKIEFEFVLCVLFTTYPEFVAAPRRVSMRRRRLLYIKSSR